MDKKGNKTGGRKKGTPNKKTAVTREMITEVLLGMHEHLADNIAQLDAKEFCDLYAKMSEFVLPKLQRTEIDAVVNNRASIEAELKTLSEED